MWHNFLLFLWGLLGVLATTEPLPWNLPLASRVSFMLVVVFISNPLNKPTLKLGNTFVWLVLREKYLFETSHFVCSNRQSLSRISVYQPFWSERSIRTILPRPGTLLKKRLWHRCFPVNSVKSLRTPFLTEHLQWPLLLNRFLQQLQMVSEEWHNVV